MASTELNLLLSSPEIRAELDDIPKLGRALVEWDGGGKYGPRAVGTSKIKTGGLYLVEDAAGKKSVMKVVAWKGSWAETEDGRLFPVDRVQYIHMTIMEVHQVPAPVPVKEAAYA